jgi:hypothetical protein
MAARIQSLRNGITPIDELSRNDLVVTDTVTVSSLDAATTYTWTLVYAPEGSTATFSGDPTAISPGSFVVDLVGSYLVRLTVDAGLGTEDTQYVRLRALTQAGLKLVAGGERRDSEGVIPVDIDAVGWAHEQNGNLLTLETLTRRANGILATDSGSGAQAIDWSAAFTYSYQATGNTTFSFTDPPDGAEVRVVFQQDGAGGHSITWPGTVTWVGGAGTPAAGALAYTVFRLIHVGSSNYIGTQTP